jgi:hypothetical protein
MAFAVAALGAATAPADAQSCGSCQPPPPPCNSCNHQPPTVVVPPPYVPPPNIVVVNAGARAQANATAIAIANVQTGNTIIRQNSVVEGGGAAVAANAATFAITEASSETVARERDVLIQAICIDATNNPHPASQTFGERNVARGYSGEIFRCIAGTHMRYTIDGRQYDCTPGQALWYENNGVQCRTQIERRNCNERSLLRRFGPGDKFLHIRDSETRTTQRETTFNGAMTMDGGVGQSVW